MRHHKTILVVMGLCLSVLAGVQGVLAEEQSVGKAATDSVDAAAKELANPAGSLASLNFNFQYFAYTGDLPHSDDQDSWSLVFQPILPFPVGDKGRNILFRPAIPVFFSQPIFDAKEADFDDLGFNMGDITFDLVYAGTEMKDKHNGFLWGLGAAGTFPTATDSRIAGAQWRLGPELFGGIVKEWGLAGALVSNQWNLGGSNDDSYSTLTAQYFYAYGLGNGWQISAAPVLTYDWKAGSGDGWAVPIGVGVAKTTKIKGNIWKFRFEVHKYAVQPNTFGPDWLVKFTITPVIKNPFVFYR